MRLLILTHRRASASFRIRWGQFLPHFAVRGDEVQVEELPGFGLRRRALLARAARYDRVVLHKRLLTAWDFARLRRHARSLVYDFDDAVCFRPSAPHRSAMRLRRLMRALSGADLVLAGNRYLADIARLRARAVRVIPSAVDPERYAPAPKLPEPTAVWIGQRATRPHLEPVVDLVARAGLRLRVIADGAPAGAEWVPWSEEVEARALAECHVGLMPLPKDPYARGKCGYKLLQYHAAGLPAVVSPVGAGRALAHAGSLVARTGEEWVDALRRIAEDPALAERLGRSGRAFVGLHFAAGPVFERLARTLE